jgi:hypothetical protein
MIVLSGYPHASYEPLERAGWRRVDKDYRANMSLRRRTECLWMNFDQSLLTSSATGGAGGRVNA